MKNITTYLKLAATPCLMIILFSCSCGKELHSISKSGSTEIMRDIIFEKGFTLTPVDPKTVQQGGGFEKTYVDTLNFGKEDSHPVWQLAQWWSKYTLAKCQLEKSPDGSFFYENAGKSKKIALYPDSSLLLEVDASREYDSPRVNGQNWPHLLIAQNFNDQSPNVGQAERLDFTMEIMLVKNENKMKEGTFNPSLHTAQTPFYFVLKNDNKNSIDYNQQIWFGIPSYDYRNITLSDKEEIALDLGTNMYMYAVPPQKIWGNVNLHDGSWHKGQADIKPIVLRAIDAMKGRGVFLNTKPEDLKITGMNFGWEVPGTFDVAIRVKNIHLKVEK